MQAILVLNVSSKMKINLKNIPSMTLFFLSCSATSFSAALNDKESETIIISSVIQEQVDSLALSGVFYDINIDKSKFLYAQLLGKDNLAENNILRFFDFLRSSKNNSLEIKQMAYHLSVLTALGPSVAETLVKGKYSWVLDSDKSNRDKREPDNLYAFFYNLAHSEIRQEIWNSMKSTGFILSDIEDVRGNFYNPSELLKEIIYQATEMVNIVIGGEEIPSFYRTVDPKCNEQYSALNVNCFGSSTYSYEHKGISIGVDHRHRPSIIANAYDPYFWASIPPEKIENIYFDYINASTITQILPEALKTKLRSNTSLKN